jgi:hypothetical protein
MFLSDALSQLAIWGAMSIALCDGCIIPFAEADGLLAQVALCRRFSLRASESHVEVIDDGGQLFGHAVTLWPADEGRGPQQMLPSFSTRW